MFSWALPVTLKHMLDHSECLGGTAQFGGLAELKDREHFYVRESKKKKNLTIVLFMSLSCQFVLDFTALKRPRLFSPQAHSAQLCSF